MKRIIYLLSLSLIFLQAQSQAQYLWASTTKGGAYGSGTIVQGNSDGTNFHTVSSLVDNIGSYPIGKMAKADNGLIYLVTGGYSSNCTICTYDPVGQTVNVIHDFGMMYQYGDIPLSGIIRATNGKLYGMTLTGGKYSNGVVYSVDPATNIYTDLYDLDSSIAIFAPGVEFLQASDGKLYALSLTSNAFNTHAFPVSLYSFDPATDSFNIAFTFRSNFSAISMGNFNPTLIQASDSRLYGVLNNGISDSILLFGYDITSDSSTMAYVKAPPITGRAEGGLVQATNGLLYGATVVSNQGAGMIYSYNISTGVFKIVLTLNSMTGLTPVADMGILSDGKLAFSTIDGGTSGMGALVSVDITSGTYSILMSMDSTTGYAPICDILEESEWPTGIKEVSTSNIILSPNPTNSTVTISSGQTFTDANITLHDLTGRVLMKKADQSGQNFTLDISAQPAGMYFVEVVQGVTVWTQKVVKE